MHSCRGISLLIFFVACAFVLADWLGRKHQEFIWSDPKNPVRFSQKGRNENETCESNDISRCIVLIIIRLFCFVGEWVPDLGPDRDLFRQTVSASWLWKRHRRASSTRLRQPIGIHRVWCVYTSLLSSITCSLSCYGLQNLKWCNQILCNCNSRSSCLCLLNTNVLREPAFIPARLNTIVWTNLFTLHLWAVDLCVKAG